MQKEKQGVLPLKAGDKLQHETPAGFRRLIENNRVVYSPNITVRATHARFFEQVKNHKLSFGDPLAEVRRHVELIEDGHRYFFKTDLKSAFDQVTIKRLRLVLARRGILPGWMIPQSHFFHERGRGGLIQGAPASPYLFEIYCRYGGLDRTLFEYCDQLGFYYSRYADDILISANRELGKRIGPSVRSIVGKFGFELSDKKTRRCFGSVEVLGYVVKGNQLSPSPRSLQPLFDPKLSDRARSGVFTWRRHVNKGSRRRRKLVLR